MRCCQCLDAGRKGWDAGSHLFTSNGRKQRSRLRLRVTDAKVLAQHLVPVEVGFGMVQTQSDTFIHWLYTNAPAAWISAAIAIITCALVVRSKKKPRRVVIREVSNSSLVRIRSEIQHKIKMTFEDKAISTIGQIEADIFNGGSEVVHSPTLVLTLPPDAVVLDVLVTPEHLQPNVEVDDNRIKLAFAYLNPVGEHDETAKMSLLVDDTTKLMVAGGGEGWSVRFLPLETRNARHTGTTA